jgi:uncharacterized lipoprotein YajG
MLFGHCNYLSNNFSLAFTPQVIVPKPIISKPVKMVGQGQPVKVTVLDERTNSVLGSRAVQGRGAEITVGGDLATIVREAICDGLQRQGFKILVDPSANNRELRVEIRNLSYTISQGLWLGGLRVECSLKSICYDGSNPLYEKFYRGELTENVGRVPTESENVEYVNTAISRAIDLLLQDEQLIKSLI